MEAKSEVHRAVKEAKGSIKGKGWQWRQRAIQEAKLGAVKAAKGGKRGKGQYKRKRG